MLSLKDKVEILEKEEILLALMDCSTVGVGAESHDLLSKHGIEVIAFVHESWRDSWRPVGVGAAAGVGGDNTSRDGGASG